MIELGAQYRNALKAVKVAWDGLGTPTTEDIHAGAATLYIEASRKGVRPKIEDVEIFLGMVRTAYPSIEDDPAFSVAELEDEPTHSLAQ